MFLESVRKVWKFQRGGGTNFGKSRGEGGHIHSVGGMDIFWNYTILYKNTWSLFLCVITKKVHVFLLLSF